MALISCPNCGNQISDKAHLCPKCLFSMDTYRASIEKIDLRGEIDSPGNEQERISREKAEAERLEQERIAREKAETERIEQERLAREKAEAERLEQERIAREKVEAERLEQDRLEKERLEAERLEQDRLEKERLETERLAQDKKERDRLAAERLESEKQINAEYEKIKNEREKLNADLEALDKKRIEIEKQHNAVMPDNRTQDIPRTSKDTDQENGKKVTLLALWNKSNAYRKWIIIACVAIVILLILLAFVLGSKAGRNLGKNDDVGTNGTTPNIIDKAGIPTEVPTSIPSLDPTKTPTPTPESTKAPTPTPKPTKASTPTPESTKAPTPTPEPTKASTPTPESTKAPTPTPEPTKAPTPTPEPTKAPTPTPEPTKASTPTPEPTKAPTSTPEVKSFRFFDNEITLIAGQGEVMDIEDYGIEREITWKTENERVAKGKTEKGIGYVIDGYSCGETVVTASDQYGNSQSVTVAVLEVKLSLGDITLNVGDTIQLEVTIKAPKGKKIKNGWFTDNESIASISNTGLITAIGKGRVNLGVELSEGGKDWIAVTVK